MATSYLPRDDFAREQDVVYAVVFGAINAVQLILFSIQLYMGDKPPEFGFWSIFDCRRRSDSDPPPELAPGGGGGGGGGRRADAIAVVVGANGRRAIAAGHHRMERNERRRLRRYPANNRRTAAVAGGGAGRAVSVYVAVPTPQDDEPRVGIVAPPPPPSHHHFAQARAGNGHAASANGVVRIAVVQPAATNGVSTAHNRPLPLEPPPSVIHRPVVTSVRIAAPPAPAPPGFLQSQSGGVIAAPPASARIVSRITPAAAAAQYLVPVSTRTAPVSVEPQPALTERRREPRTTKLPKLAAPPAASPAATPSPPANLELVVIAAAPVIGPDAPAPTTLTPAGATPPNDPTIGLTGSSGDVSPPALPALDINLPTALAASSGVLTPPLGVMGPPPLDSPLPTGADELDENGLSGGVDLSDDDADGGGGDGPHTGESDSGNAMACHPDAILEIGAALKPLPLGRTVAGSAVGSHAVSAAGGGVAAPRPTARLEDLIAPEAGGIGSSIPIYHEAAMPLPALAAASAVAGGDGANGELMLAGADGQPFHPPRAVMQAAQIVHANDAAAGAEESERSHLNPPQQMRDESSSPSTVNGVSGVDARTVLSGPVPPAPAGNGVAGAGGAVAADGSGSGSPSTPRRNWRVRVEKHSLAWWLHRMGFVLSAFSLLFYIDPLSIFGFIPYWISLTTVQIIALLADGVVSCWLYFTVTVLYRRIGSDTPTWLKWCILMIGPVYLVLVTFLYYVPKYATGLDCWTTIGSALVALMNIAYALITPWVFFKVRKVLREYIERRASSNESSRPVEVDYSAIHTSMTSLRRFVIVVTISAGFHALIYSLATIDGIHNWITDPYRPYRRPFAHTGTASMVMSAGTQLISVLLVRACWIPITPIHTPSTVANAGNYIYAR